MIDAGIQYATKLHRHDYALELRSMKLAFQSHFPADSQTSSLEVKVVASNASTYSVVQGIIASINFVYSSLRFLMLPMHFPLLPPSAPSTSPQLT